MNLNPKRAEYLVHIENQKRSGLSVKRFCKENDISECQFIYYKRIKMKSQSQKAFSEVKIKIPKNPIPAASQDAVNIDPIWLADFLKSLVGKK